jgi:F420-dependent oxidoreductase-like protein
MAHTERMRFGPAIMQMPARTPAMTAMTAATLDLMSEGRFLLGLGLSGPQVVEGWHGQAYGKPLAKTREYVEIVRTIWRREAPLEHHGPHYDIPYSGSDATGLGKPLKIIVHPRRADIPIYLAAIGPKNVELCAEIADGWLPIFFSPQRFRETYGASLDAGFGRAGGDKSLDDFDVAPTVTVLVGDDVDALRNMVKPMAALYIGGMGARGRNFYNDLACRYGFEAAAKEIQDLYLDGKKGEAVAAVPDELVDEIALLGPKERIADRLGAWRECGITTMILGAGQPDALRLMAELVL